MTTPVGAAPDLSIVIVSYNARADLEACLDSLTAHPPALSYEVVVVDNASTDGSAESIAAGFQRIVQLVIGLGVVTAGVLFTLDNLGVLRARDYLRFWPIVFVAIGAGLIIQGQTQKRFLAGGFWVLLGAVMLSRHERTGGR